MSEQEEAPVEGEASQVVETMAIELVFEVGRQSLPVHELRTIQPGFTFELDSPLAAPATIRANGRVIGKGELMEVDGRLGVRVTEMAGNG